MARKNTEYDITEAFSRIEDEIIASMMRNLTNHRAEETKEGYNWSQWQVEQLASLDAFKKRNAKKYGKEFRSINNKIREIISAQRAEGNAAQEIRILEAIRKGFKPVRSGKTLSTDGEFFKINDRKMDALINAVEHDFKKGEQAILRRANDQYRRIIFDAQVYANSGAGTYEKAVDMAVKDFLAAGINCIEYSNGARHTMKDYADMAIRTAGKRAYLTGEGEKRQEYGITTVRVNKRGKPCPLCLPFVGKVLIDDVWSGGKASDGPYPLMSQAISAGLYHPRCKDVHSTYIEGISSPAVPWTDEEIEDIEQEVKRESKKNYAARQAEKFGRLALYALDSENQKKYKAREEEWKYSSVDGGSKEELKEITSEKQLEQIVDNIPSSKEKTIESINSDATDALLNAYDDRRKHFNLNMTSSDDLRTMGDMNPVTVNYDGVPLETAQAFDDTIQKLSEEYYTGFTKIEVGDKKEFFGTHIFATTQHSNAVGQKTLILNPHKTRDYNKMTERIRELSDKGYAVNIADGLEGQYIPTHEFAHSLIDLSGNYKNYVGMDVKQMKGIKKELDSVFDRYKSEVNVLESIYREKELAFLNGSMSLDVDIKDLEQLKKEALAAKEALDAVKISKYSMESSDEFMAEAFTQSKIGVSQSKYTNDVMEVIDRHFKKETVENTGKSGIIKANRTISGHSNTPKNAEPNDIIDHLSEDGTVDARGFYDNDGMKEKDIHTTNHGNPKHHNYGEHGEHGHDYEWNEDGSLKEKTTRELREDERKENGDIL